MSAHLLDINCFEPKNILQLSSVLDDPKIKLPQKQDSFGVITTKNNPYYHLMPICLIHQFDMRDGSTYWHHDEAISGYNELIYKYPKENVDSFIYQYINGDNTSLENSMIRSIKAVCDKFNCDQLIVEFKKPTREVSYMYDVVADVLIYKFNAQLYSKPFDSTKNVIVVINRYNWLV
jgi:hypothetical protein